jgi:hypothetical protein
MRARPDKGTPGRRFPPLTGASPFFLEMVSLSRRVDSPAAREHVPSRRTAAAGVSAHPLARQSRYERLHLICHNCNPEGVRLPAADFAAVHKLAPYRAFTWSHE